MPAVYQMLGRCPQFKAIRAANSAADALLGGTKTGSGLVRGHGGRSARGHQTMSQFGKACWSVL